MSGKPERIVRELAGRFGRRYSEDAGIRLADRPGPLYQLLVLATLLSARISADIAVAAARELFAAGYRSPKARKTMHRLWPTEVIPGEALQLLPLPRHFGQLSEMVTEEMISAPCGPDPGVHRAGLRQFADAGFDEVYVGQVSGAPEAFFEFYAEQVLPTAGGN